MTEKVIGICWAKHEDNNRTEDISSIVSWVFLEVQRPSKTWPFT